MNSRKWSPTYRRRDKKDNSEGKYNNFVCVCGKTNNEDLGVKILGELITSINKNLMRNQSR